MKLVLIYLFFYTTALFGQNSPKTKSLNIKPGNWSAYLQLTEKDKLPFKLIVNKAFFSIQNADEIIQLSNYRVLDDSVIVDFPTFNSSLHFSIEGKKKLKGYWINYNKGKDYKIPFLANYGYTTRFEKNSYEKPENINGNWKIAFEYKTKPEMSVGVFKQLNENLSGTFLTETGDYRYLEGNQFGNNFYLSCFDGSHAFLFKAEIKNDTLIGRFLSGKHWEGCWMGVKNDTFTISDPDSITTIINNDLFSFTLKDLQGNNFTFPNNDYKNKVVIIQIMGTWCPNCMDETRYYKELYSKYHSQGLEIISIGYEIGDTFEDYVKKINLLKERLELNFTFLVGGAANKSLASEQFSMLNEVISFPTSIYIGRDGTVKRVHTGFNGPGTGSYYTEYIEKTNQLIESLLKN